VKSRSCRICGGRLLASASRPKHSPPRSSRGKNSDELMPYVSWMRRSCSGRSIADQSGKCRFFLLTMVRDGKLISGSIGKAAGSRGMCDPSDPTRAACEKVLPWRRRKNARSQRNNRTAFRTIASNTGLTSVGDWLMTRRISEVAACCVTDSASLRSRSSMICRDSALVASSDVKINSPTHHALASD